MGRYSAVIDVHLLLMNDEKVLLGKRQNTGYQDGNYHLPAGHLEQDETVVDAVVREANEELGISIMGDSVQLVYVLHQYSKGGRIGLFFRADRWSGTVANMEPEKCSGLEWFRLDRLPTNIVPYARFVLDDLQAGSAFGLYGWEIRKMKADEHRTHIVTDLAKATGVAEQDVAKIMDALGLSTTLSAAEGQISMSSARLSKDDIRLSLKIGGLNVAR